MPRGSAVFGAMNDDERAVARFLIKLFRLDENNAGDVVTVINLMEGING